jgi:hypothetical protein
MADRINQLERVLTFGADHSRAESRDGSLLAQQDTKVGSAGGEALRM